MTTPEMWIYSFMDFRLLPRGKRIGLLTTLALLSAFSAHAGEDRFKKPDKIRKINAIQYLSENGKRVSFGNEGLKWTGPGDCSQREKMAPIIEVQADDVTLRNAVILDAPDGIHVSGKNVILENIVFPEVCEDAITVNGADNLIIRNCSFRGARDKAIQINKGTNVLIENCWFEDCAKPVRVKPGATVTVRNNISRGSKFFVLADGDGAVATVEGNQVSASKVFVRANSGARIEIRENRLSRVAKKTESSEGGEIVGE